MRSANNTGKTFEPAGMTPLEFNEFVASRNGFVGGLSVKYASSVEWIVDFHRPALCSRPYTPPAPLEFPLFE